MDVEDDAPCAADSTAVDVSPSVPLTVSSPLSAGSSTRVVPADSTVVLSNWYQFEASADPSSCRL